MQRFCMQTGQMEELFKYKKSINIYATKTTTSKIEVSTPWFVSSKAVSGNGAVSLIFTEYHLSSFSYYGIRPECITG